jgi:hypothetical protein
LRLPMQTPNHGQWWSSFYIQTPHV